MGIQFLNSFIIAALLGPLYLGIWGFINLILQYAAQINLGIPYSLNVMLSVNKDDDRQTRELLSGGVYFYLFITLVFLALLSLYGFLGLDWGDKYRFSDYIIPVFLIAILSHFNTLFTNYFRIKNKLKEIMFFQSIVPVMTLLAVFLVEEKELLIKVLVGVMLTGQLLSLVIFLLKLDVKISFRRSPLSAVMPLLLRKGLYLFIYNASFYLIIISTRTVVSAFYEPMEFGYFTFAFTLANAVMLLFDSFSFLIYPKILNRLSRNDQSQSLRILDMVRNGYVVAVHLIMYSFILLFPLIIYFFPAYQSQYKTFGLIVMTLVFYANCYIYSSVLIARSRENILGGMAFSILTINVLFALIIAAVFRWSYEYVILATLLAYVVYNILLTLQANRLLLLKNNWKTVMADNFPLSLYIPFTLCFVFTVTEQPHGYFGIVLLLFVLLNIRKLKGLKDLFMKILKNPQSVNI
jgi:O-antigen/teichoic acid export membrane protein